MHLTHVAKAFAVTGFGDFIRPFFEIGFGGVIVEDFAFFIDDFSGGDAPDFMLGFVDLGDLSKEVQRFHGGSK
jgi:hypothetical protein